MKIMRCELCGSSDFIKEDGIYKCQYCGTKYTDEEVNSLIIKGKVDVSGSVVKIDEENAFEIGKRFEEGRIEAAKEENAKQVEKSAKVDAVVKGLNTTAEAMDATAKTLEGIGKFAGTFSDSVSKMSPYSKKSGCYVATAVYGSYDCPEVWTLRRYRDLYLKQYWLGRRFIDFYYMISPHIVKRFRHMRLFNRFCRMLLDNIVNRLNMNGYSNTPYND